MDSIHLQSLGYDIKCTELDPNYVKNAQDLGLDCIQHNTQDRFPFKWRIRSCVLSIRIALF